VRSQGLGWDEAACASNPVGCLNSRYDKLSQLERSVDQSVRAIRGEFDRVSALVSEQELVGGKNTACQSAWKPDPLSAPNVDPCLGH
jgi:hypothetical protein